MLSDKNFFAPLLSRRRFLSFAGGMALSLALAPACLAAQRDAIGEKLSAPGVLQDSDGKMPARKPRAPRLLVIDPGHGGHDPGAIGHRGTQEKDITLDIARRMAAIITAGGDKIRVQLTRDSDVFIPLPERVRISRSARADLFISIHADSAPSRLARGLSAYTLSEKASDNFAKALATQENRIEAMGGVDLGAEDQDVAAILMDLTARRTRETSQRARYSFVQSVGHKWRLLERPMRGANFAVLRAPDVPSFLVETGFLSSPEDEALLTQAAQRQKIAALMANELADILMSPLFG